MLSIFERIESLIKDNKNPTFKVIGKELIKDYYLGIFKTQTEIADTCFVSIATVTQFAKACLCEGYKELIIRLKVEHENSQSKIKDEQQNQKNKDHSFDLSMINTITQWITSKENFIFNLIDDIKKYKKIWIVPSGQTLFAAKFLEDGLTNLGYFSKIIDLSVNLEIGKYYNFVDELILFIITGRDIDTLYRTYDYLSKFNNNIHIITTTNHLTDYSELDSEKNMIINFPEQKFFYKYRSYALISLFFALIELL